LLPGGHISLAGYHLTKLQVGGASALSNVVYMIFKKSSVCNIRSAHNLRGRSYVDV